MRSLHSQRGPLEGTSDWTLNKPHSKPATPHLLVLVTHFLPVLPFPSPPLCAIEQDKTEAALLSYVTMAFQSPLSNPSFHLKYSFVSDETGNVSCDG